MIINLKFYRIKLLEDFLEKTNKERAKLIKELKINATDSTIVKRRFRMLRHLSQFENQIIEKIQNFDTDDLEDFSTAWIEIESIINRGA